MPSTSPSAPRPPATRRTPAGRHRAAGQPGGRPRTPGGRHRRPGPPAPRSLLAVPVLILVLAIGLPAAVAAPAGAERARADPVPTHGVWPLSPQPLVIRAFDPPDAPWGAGHRGVDLAASIGQEVRAAADGVVSFAAQLAGRGVIAVVHGALRTTYEPVTPVVSVGDRVSAGSVIGHLQGGSGHCAPVRPCLHWGLLRGREYLDPLSLLGRRPSRLLPVWGIAAAYGGDPASAGRPLPQNHAQGQPGTPAPGTRSAVPPAPDPGAHREGAGSEEERVAAGMDLRTAGGLSILGLLGTVCLVRYRPPQPPGTRRGRRGHGSPGRRASAAALPGASRCCGACLHDEEEEEDAAPVRCADYPPCEGAGDLIDLGAERVRRRRPDLPPEPA